MASEGFKAFKEFHWVSERLQGSFSLITTSEVFRGFHEASRGFKNFGDRCDRRVSEG